MLTTTVVPAADTFSLSTMVPGPGMQLPVNAYCLRGSQPTLIDAGLPPLSDELCAALWQLIDPVDLRWIVITHDDRDHIGSLAAILDDAPHATVVTNLLSVIRIAEDWTIPPDRLRLVNAGDRVDIGDDVLEAFRPPTYDSPGTLAFHALHRNVCFSSDSLGSVLPLSAEPGMTAEDVPAVEYHDGTAMFASMLSPWLHDLSADRWQAAVADLQRRDIASLLSGHGLPVTTGLAPMLEAFARSYSSPPFVAPTQDAIDLMSTVSGPPQ